MNKVKFLYALVCSMFLTACSEEENLMPAGRTGIQVALTEKASVETRKTPEELTKPLAKEFHLKITNAAGKSVYDAGYTSELIPASAGTYTVEATYGDNSELAVDAPYYKGEAEVEVTDGKTAKETIYCKVANALASVGFDNTGAYTFEDQFSSYAVKVEVGNLSTELKGDGESAYYRAGSRPTFTFVGTLKDGGEEVEVPLEDDKFSQAATFAAGAHCVITLKLGASTPGVRVEVSKVEVKNVTINETISMEWLPKPKVEAEGFDANNTLTFVETESKNAKLNLNLASALQEMKLKFNFEDPQFATLNEQEYLLSKDKATLESTLGITLPNIDDKEASIDLSALIDKLQTNAGTPTTNALTIDVQANNRWSSEDREKELTYTLNCNKPVFRVDAYPGNIWTKEFTMNPLREEQVESGDFAKISSDVTYQFSLDGETDWIELGADLRKEQLTPNTKYYIRGLYRNEVPGEIVEVSTYPVIELENGDMEDWNYTDGPIEEGWFGNVDGPYWKRWYVRATKDESTDGWCSLNYYTTSNNALRAYNSNSGTEQSTDKHDGNYAAEIKTIGWGDGTTAASPISIINQNTPGELFLGKINGSEKEYGVIYESRPTNLIFWYKYIPKGSHEFTAKIVIENREEKIVLAEEIFNGSQQNSYVEKNIFINYKDEYKHLKPTHMYILFCSGENSNSEVDTGSISKSSRHIGNKLYIDDISLVYDK